MLTARSQKALANASIKSLKVLTPAQAAQLAAQVQPQAASAIPTGTAKANNGSAVSGIGTNAASTTAQNTAQTTAKSQAQSAAATITAANSEALDMALAQAGNAAQAANDDPESDAAATALSGARITAAKNPSADQIASSKQQAFANLKPAADVKATETQALQSDAGISKADSKDTDAKSGDSGDDSSDNSQTASNPTIQTPDQQNFQAPSTAPQNTMAHLVDSALSNTTAAAAGSIPGQSNTNTPAGTLTVGPSTDQPITAKLDTGSLAVTIAAKSIEGAKQFDIRLDPPELGRVDVRLSVDSTGKAQAHLTVEKPQTLDMLQRDSGSLQKSLRTSGVDLSNNGLQFSLKNQQHQSGSAPAPAAQGRKLSVTTIPAATASTSTYGFAHDHARLDIRV